jgi:hypothetical protein
MALRSRGGRGMPRTDRFISLSKRGSRDGSNAQWDHSSHWRLSPISPKKQVFASQTLEILKSASQGGFLSVSGAMSSCPSDIIDFVVALVE